MEDTPEYLQEKLLELNACDDSLSWSTGKTYAEAWEACENSDWIIWLLEATNSLPAITNEHLVCRFARHVLHLNNDPRVLACIEIREAWTIGAATDQERAAAKNGAWDAARDAVYNMDEDAAWDTALCSALAAGRDAATDAARDSAKAAAQDRFRTASDTDRFALRPVSAWAAMGADTNIKQCQIIRELCPRPTL